MIEIEGIPSSAEIREGLAAEGRPVLLAFSRGKDSIAAWLALRDAGVEVIPFHMYRIPGELDFERESMEYFEGFFSTRIARLPHEAIYRWLNGQVYQAPERLAIIEAAQLPTPSYEDIVSCFCADLGFRRSDIWLADGVRACDSIVRRLAIQKSGAQKQKSMKVSVVWDWTKSDVMGAIAAAGVRLPVDYEWFGRSFDGLDARFMVPLKENAPADYAKVIEWYPLVEAEVMRWGLGRD